MEPATSSVRDMAVDADIFQSKAVAVVNPVNCIGVSGKGLALVFKTRFPAMHRTYAQACARGDLRPGHILPLAVPAENWQGRDGQSDAHYRYVVHLATKDHWKQPSQMAWIQSGVTALHQWAREAGIESIAIPAIGADLGKLNWADVRRVILAEFSGASVQVELYPPRPPDPTQQRRLPLRPRS